MVDSSIPNHLLIQWHVTERCNLRCRHCYQDRQICTDPSLSTLMHTLDQLTSLARDWKTKSKTTRFHITIAGGEPLIRNDFFDFIRAIRQRHPLFSFGILTNGTRIHAHEARQLRTLKPAFVQISIDGDAQTHDQIRGQAAYDRAVSGITHLVKQGIRTIISFTAHQQNYRQFRDVARLGIQLNVSRVWADRLIPLGEGTQLQDMLLTSEQTREFFQIMYKERKRAQKSWFCNTEIAMHRALQFLVAGGRPYHCPAGDTLLTIQPNGDIVPCRRMPIVVGNVQSSDLARVYFGSPMLQNLRNPSTIPAACYGCFYAKLCRGGLKCLSHALTGDPFQRDPGCWLVHLPNPGEATTGFLHQNESD